ncbi:hypothetical protein KCU95_g16968, partial [Aureobasidium melanogenum]
MGPSEEIGSPSLALRIEVPRSPSLPGNGTPLWDSMSLPSSPSLRARVPDSSRARVEPLFRFLDLPAEIRNMIYEFSFSSYPISWSADSLCACEYDFAHHAYLGVMKRQFKPPSITSVNKLIREEAMCLYYGTTNFRWYWDPLRVNSEGGRLFLPDSIGVLARLLDFAAINGVLIKSITVCSPHDCHWPDYVWKDFTMSVRFLAPLRRSIDRIGRAHPMLRELKFEDEDSFTRRLFDLSGTLKPSVLKHHHSLKRQLRLFLRDDPDGADMLGAIEDVESENWWYALEARWERKEQRRIQNKAKGLERWTGVLRSRPSKE